MYDENPTFRSYFPEFSKLFQKTGFWKIRNEKSKICPNIQNGVGVFHFLARKARRKSCRYEKNKNNKLSELWIIKMFLETSCHWVCCTCSTGQSFVRPAWAGRGGIDNGPFTNLGRKPSYSKPISCDKTNR